jgi:hypothetical protein
MKIAFLLYGQPRYYKNVLQQWKDLFNEFDSDIFYHTWYGLERNSVITNINEIIEDLNPKEIHISQQHKLIDLIPSDAKFENQSYHGLQQAYSISHSAKILRDYKWFFDQNYDFIVRCRLDIKFHNLDNLITFLKSDFDKKNFYVAANHWPDNQVFDDNIIISSPENILSISEQYFLYTIDFINKTKIIPGGENNLHRFFDHKNLRQYLIRENSLNFDLLHIPEKDLIINQNG